MTPTFILTVIWAVVTVTEVQSECPLIDIVECSCKTLVDHSQEEYSILTCKNLHDEDDLKNVVEASKGYFLYELEILNSSFLYLPTFIGTYFEVISIKNSTFDALSNTETAFQGLEEKLRLIEIVDCRHTSSWDWSHLSNMEQMVEIHISNSDMGDVTEGISRIQHINVVAFVFIKNQIEVLDDRAFAPFANLKRLTLDNNHINTLKRTMFPRPAKLLRVLSLNYNNIRDLPEDIFTEMPRLKSIYLSGNPLHTIDEIVFKPIWNQLQGLLFYETNLYCDCKLSWLKEEDNSRLYMHAECHEPATLKGRLLAEILRRELECV